MMVKSISLLVNEIMVVLLEEEQDLAWKGCVTNSVTVEE